MRPDGYIGHSVPRREDKRLLRGEGTFVGDMVLPEMVHVAFARSQNAHATIESIDTSVAAEAEGVVLALSGEELARELAPIGGMQVSAPKGWSERVRHRIELPAQHILADDKVRYVGEAYALVVAEDRYLAEDAVEQIITSLTPIQALPNAEAALAGGAAVVHPNLGSNLVAELHTEKGDVAAAMEKAPHRIKRRFVHHRYAAMPMECRGVVAEYDRRTDTLTVWSSTQVVHWLR